MMTIPLIIILKLIQLRLIFLQCVELYHEIHNYLSVKKSFKDDTQKIHFKSSGEIYHNGLELMSAMGNKEFLKN
jgi:hypothetical protein